MSTKIKHRLRSGRGSLRTTAHGWAPPQRGVTAGQLRMMLDSLAKLPSLAQACERAGVRMSQVTHLRSRYPELDRAISEAVDVGVGQAEAVAWQRAVEGVPKPVYWRGERVDEVMEASDRLLEFMLKAHKPDVYRPQSDLHVDVRQPGTLAVQPAPSAEVWAEAAVGQQRRVLEHGED